MGQGPVPVDNSDRPGTGFLEGSCGFGVSQETAQALLSWLI